MVVVTIHNIVATDPTGKTTEGQVETDLFGDILVTPELIESLLQAHRTNRPAHVEGDISITLKWSHYIDMVEAFGVKIAVLS
jgi:hypothetical protein